MRAYLFLLTLLFSVAHAQTDEDIVVVVNSESELEQLDKRTLRNLYMGGINRYRLTPLALSTGMTTRIIFNTKVLGLTESRIQSYWAQMRFSGGRARPPREVTSLDDLLSLIESNPDMVGYVPASLELPANVKVLYHSDSPTN